MSTDTPMKRCRRCRNEYPATRQYFHRHKNQQYGVDVYCLECRKIYDAQKRELERLTLQEFDAIAPDPRLACMIRRLHYGDCLTCGDWTLERQLCQHVSSIEDDNAPDKCLVQGTYTEYMLYHQDRLIGVFDIRANDCTTVYIQQDRYAHYLMVQCGWTVRDTRHIPGGAITLPETDLLRAKRLVKVPPKRQANRRRTKQSTASQYQTA